MSNLLNLIKINLLTYFDIYKIRNASNKKEKSDAIKKVLLIVVLLFYFAFMIYGLSFDMTKAFLAMGKPELILALMMTFSSVYILTTDILKVNGSLFNFRDYNLLFSLPIKKNTVIFSKIFNIYFFNFIYVLLFMIPSTIAYCIFVKTSILFHIMNTIAIIVMPLVPIIISVIIGSILTLITSRFKHKNLGQTIVTFIFVLGLMYFSSVINNKEITDIANVAGLIVDKVKSLYPLVTLYLDMIKDYNILSLLLFIIIPFVLFYLFIKVIDTNFEKINNRLNSSYSNRKYKLKEYKSNSQVKALFIKEWKRYLASPNYVINTALGPILMIVSIVALIFGGGSKLDQILKVPGFSDMLTKAAPLMLGGFCALTTTTAASISLEGKNFWIVKTLPVNPKDIFEAKILVNLIILLPAILLSSITLSIYLHFNFFSFLLMIIIPIIYAFFTSFVGLILNLLFPNFEWKNEIMVIKQSIPVFGSIMIGMILIVVPFTIKYTISTNLFMMIVGLIILIFDIVLYYWLKTKGVEKFNKIN